MPREQSFQDPRNDRRIAKLEGDIESLKQQVSILGKNNSVRAVPRDIRIGKTVKDETLGYPVSDGQPNTYLVELSDAEFDTTLVASGKITTDYYPRGVKLKAQHIFGEYVREGSTVCVAHIKGAEHGYTGEWWIIANQNHGLLHFKTKSGGISGSSSTSLGSAVCDKWEVVMSTSTLKQTLDSGSGAAPMTDIVLNKSSRAIPANIHICALRDDKGNLVAIWEDCDA